MKKNIAIIVLFSALASSLTAMMNDAGFIYYADEYPAPEVASIEDLLNGFHKITTENDYKGVAIEEIYSAINAIYSYENNCETRNLRKTPARKREVLRLFKKLSSVLEEQVSVLLLIEQDALTSNDTQLTVAVTAALEMVNNHVMSLKGNENRAINVQPTAQVLVSLLNILMQTTNVLANHAAAMPLTNEAQIAQHNAVQWWGIRIGAVGVVVYLALQGCNASSYCNVPLPSVETLLLALPKLISG